MPRTPLWSLVAALACAPRIETESATPPTAEVSEPSEPACPPLSFEKAEEATMIIMESNPSWRHDPDESWRDSSSIGLAFGIPSFAAFVSFGISSSSEEIDAALTLQTGDRLPSVASITDEQLAGIGDRAAGLTVKLEHYVETPRGTRKQVYRFSHIAFARCGVVVNVMADLGADPVIRIARELDWWLVKAACC